MYQSYFRFESYPFQNTPNPAYYFSSQAHREALASMLYGVREGKGFILVTGDVGAGKTTLVQALKSELGDQHIVIEISNPWVSHEDILNTICSAIGVTTEMGQTGMALMNALKNRLIELDESGRRVVLVIDEAHQLPERTLEGIRLLSNIETPTRKLIQIIFLGQDELVTMLGRYSMRQIQQRIALSFHLSGLSRQDAESYIHHRLRIARGSEALFPSESIDIIYRTSQGVPRIINHLCDNSLLTAYAKSAHFVDEETVREVIEGLPPMQVSAPPAPAPIVSPQAAVANAPHKPAASHALPLSHLILPQAEEQKAMGHAPVKPPTRQAGCWWRYAFPALLLGLVMGAAAIWFMPLFSPFSPGGATSQRPGASAPALAAAEDLHLRMAPEFYLKSAAAPAATAVEIPFPVDPTRITRVEVVTVTPERDVSIAVSRKLGAWNETVQDVVLGANPGLASLSNLPPNTVVRLPMLGREHMIVQDSKGGMYVYYASFSNEIMAKENLDAVKMDWADAFIVATQRKGVPVYRIYLGKYDTINAAENVVRSVWFRYLPSLN